MVSTSSQLQKGISCLFGFFPSWWCQRSCKDWGKWDSGVKSWSTTAWWGPCYCKSWCQYAPVISNFLCLLASCLFSLNMWKLEEKPRISILCFKPCFNLSPLLYVCHIVLWVRHSLSLVNQIGKSSRNFFPVSSFTSSFSFFFEKPLLPFAAHWRLY